MSLKNNTFRYNEPNTAVSLMFAQKTEILKAKVINCFKLKLFELRNINKKNIEQIFIKCIQSSYIKLLLQKYLEEIVKNTVESSENKMVLDNLKLMIEYLKKFKIDFVKQNKSNFTHQKRNGGKQKTRTQKTRTRKMKGGFIGFITAIFISMIIITKISASNNPIQSLSEPMSSISENIDVTDMLLQMGTIPSISKNIVVTDILSQMDIINNEVEKVPASLNPYYTKNTKLTSEKKNWEVEKISEFFNESPDIFNMNDSTSKIFKDFDLTIFDKNTNLLDEFNESTMLSDQGAHSIVKLDKTGQFILKKLEFDNGKFWTGDIWREIINHKIYEIIHQLNPGLNIKPNKVIEIDYFNGIIKTKYAPNGDLQHYLIRIREPEDKQKIEMAMNKYRRNTEILRMYGISNTDADINTRKDNIIVIDDNSDIIISACDLTELKMNMDDNESPFNIFVISYENILNANNLFNDRPDLKFYPIKDEIIAELNAKYKIL